MIWHDQFHMGLIHFMAYPDARTEEEILSTIKRVLTDEFFQAIEVSALIDEDLFKEIGKMCETAKVELLVAAQPVVLTKKLDLGSIDERERNEAVQELKSAIDKAYISGARTVALLSGKIPKAEIEKAKDQLVKSLVELCDYAKSKCIEDDRTISVNLEIFDWAVDKKALVGPAPVAFEIASRVRNHCGNFGLTVDLSHQPLLFEDPFYTVSLLSPFITHVHIGNAVLEKDHPLYGDLHPRFGINGGVNDVEELTYFLRTLWKNNYFEKRVATQKPVISFEIKPLPDEDPDLVIANAKRTFLAAYSKFLKEVR